jgi:hypothetical protein
MRYDRHDELRTTPHLGRAGAFAGVSLAVLIIAGAMFYAFSGDRPVATAEGFKPVIDAVRPLPSTTGQGGG